MSCFRSGRIVPSERRPGPRNSSPPAPQSALLEAGQQLAATGYRQRVELSRCIEWFRHTFAQMARYHGKVTLRDFRQVAREYEVSRAARRALCTCSISLHLRLLVQRCAWCMTGVPYSAPCSVTCMSLVLLSVAAQEFALNLFMLFDSDGNGSVSLQELVGGLSKLTK